MAGNVKKPLGPKADSLFAQPRPQQQMPTQAQPQQTLTLDLTTIEGLAQICKHYNLTQINVGNIVIANTRVDQMGPIGKTKEEKKVTDEEILHNPYAGM